MKDYRPILITLYESVLQSSSDEVFYLNIHRYIDFIRKTPELCAVIEDSEIEYSKRHRDLWKEKTEDENELDKREEHTFRVERFSLYASDYCGLEMRIYWPIEYYKNPPPEIDGLQDPVVFLMLKGLESTKRMKKWSDKTLEMYYKWYDPKEKQRYEKNIRQFHVDFLLELEKTGNKHKEIPEPSKPSIPLSFNSRTGDFVFYDVSGNLSPGTQEFKVFSTLYDSPEYTADYLTLLKSYIPGIESASKTYRDNLSLVIRDIKREFKILSSVEIPNTDIFLNLKKFGYRLVFSPLAENPE
jgi:hypothetical protein